MFGLSRRKRILRLSVIGVFVAAIVFGLSAFITNNIKKDVEATTGDGGTVQITHGGQVSYDDYRTSYFDITTSTGTIRGYCAQPRFSTPDNGTYTATLLDGSTNTNKLLKLLIYIKENDNSYTAQARNEMFNYWTDDENERYAWTHAIIGAIYDNDYTGVSEANVNYINRMIGLLQSWVDSDADVWVLAQDYQLYVAGGGENTQQIIWTEGTPYITGQINVQKCDAENNSSSCIPQGNADFSGIEFTVYNTSGRKVFDPNTNRIYANNDVVAVDSTDRTGAVSFPNLPAGNVQYTITETKTNQSYQLTANSQTVTLTRSGQLENLIFKDIVNKGKVTINKKDSQTGNCVTVGNAVFANTKFQLINNSTNPIMYNGNSIANGAEVASVTLDTATCTATFDNLPYGSYTIKEIAVGMGYSINTGTQNVNIPTNSSYNVLADFVNSPVLGKITVNKVDKNTGTCTTQGDANFAGATFKLVNKSANPIYYNGTKIAVNGTIDSKSLASGACNVVFENLPYGTYEVQETTAGGHGYQTNTTIKQVSIPTDNNVNVAVSYDNTPVLGKVTVNKIDRDTGTCTTTGKLSFNGTEFSITNNSANSIYYNGRFIAKGAVIDTKTLANDACSVTFENLPYGTYTIKETKTTEGYVLNTTPQTVTIPASGTSNVNVSTTFENQAIRGDVKFVKMDANNNKPMRDVLFSISAVDENNNIGETHIVVTNKDGIVDTSSSFILHSINTNGYDALYDEVDPISFSGFGSWFGIDKKGKAIPVHDDVGALPYGTYIIQELRCGSNLFCTGILNQKTTITINSNKQVINLGDWDNTCEKFSLETQASDPKDGDHYIEIGKEVQLKDTIEYCVKPNTNFTIKGILMDKSTGEPLLVNGKTVESSVDLKSADECGTTEMYFNFDASELGGKDIVVFETLYYKDDIITQHDDIEDVGQTITMVKLHTYATNNNDGGKVLPYDSYVEVKDVVTYCLKPGQEYTLKGVLMNKNTNDKLLINNEPVESEVTFTPEEACGKTEMIFKFNTTGLNGAELVVFESLYYDDELVIEHNDINDADQTVSVEIPTPNTGLFTSDHVGWIESDNSATFIGITVVVLSFGGYVATRIIKRKRMLK